MAGELIPGTHDWYEFYDRKHPAKSQMPHMRERDLAIPEDVQTGEALPERHSSVGVCDGASVPHGDGPGSREGTGSD